VAPITWVNGTPVVPTQTTGNGDAAAPTAPGTPTSGPTKSDIVETASGFRQGKPNLLFFFWPDKEDPLGQACQELETKVFIDGQIVDLAKKFVCIRVNGKTCPPQVLRTFGVATYPTIVFEVCSKKIVSTVRSKCVEPKVFAKAMQSVLATNTKVAEALKAQEAKLDLVCRKIGLEEGQRVLDIGCGWGSFAKFAAEKYGAQVVGITVSKEQVALGKELCKGLPVELRLQDYREVDETFDHIVSLGMFEHVGCKNYREYFKVAQRCLKEGGLFLLHTIGSNVSARSGEPWLTKYIFPGGMLPSMAQVARAAEGLFVIEEAHNFGADYDKTLMAWFANFDAAWLSLRARYDDRFYRMWKYYLLMCAGTFRARSNQLWQIILSPHGVAGGYRAIR